MLGRMSNQHINRNLCTVPYFFSSCINFSSTNQQGNDAHIGKNLRYFLGQCWSFWEINRSTGLCALNIFSRVLVSELRLINQLINKDMMHTLVKIQVIFSANVGQDGKSTHHATYTSFPVNTSMMNCTTSE